MRSERYSIAVMASAMTLVAACARGTPSDRVRVSGYVEATEVRVAPEVGGRLVELRVDEGARVAQGDVLARLDTTDTELALRRATAEREQTAAQLALLQAGSRPEEIREAEAQVATAAAELSTLRVEQDAAERELERIDTLAAADIASRKQHDDAAARRDAARGQVKAADERVQRARQTLAKIRAGARPQEIAAARARVAAADAQIATLQKALNDAIVRAPLAGIVTEKLADQGELVAPRTPILVITDLDRAWANVYVDEPLVPRLKLGQQIRIFTDAGGALDGAITYISPKAEFTPRNVQTADERAKLVYRIKVSVDNREGILKAGMPVEADLPR